MIIFDAEIREIGTVSPVRGGWQAITRAGIPIGRYGDESAARAALERYVDRFRRLLIVRSNSGGDQDTRFSRDLNQLLSPDHRDRAPGGRR